MKLTVLASLASVACGVAILGAQGAGRAGQSAAAPQRNWYSVTITTVKPEHVDEWIQIQKSQTIPMQRKGGLKARDTWQSGAPFGDGNMFGVVTPIDKFATYDLAPLARRMLGDAAGQAYQNKLAALTMSRRTFAAQDRLELSIPPAPNAKFVAAILTDTTVLSGHADQFEAYIKNDLLPVLKNDHVVGYQVSRTVFGGDVNEYHTVQLLATFADIDKGPATTRQLGTAGAAALAAKVAPHVAHAERTILRYVPDLSFAPKPVT
jgi:hypothetical protein